MSQSSLKHNFLSFTGRSKILHSTWLAFFATIAGGVAFAVICALFLDEPKSKMAEVMPGYCRESNNNTSAP